MVNVVSERLAEAMNVSCGPYAAEVDEFDLAGVGKARSRQVKAPGVELAPLRFECVLSQCLALGQGAGAGNLVLAKCATCMWRMRPGATAGCIPMRWPWWASWAAMISAAPNRRSACGGLARERVAAL